MKAVRGVVAVVLVAVVTYLAAAVGLVRRLTAVNEIAQRAAFGAAAGVVAIIAGFTVTTMFFFAAAEDSRTLRDFRQTWGAQMNALLVQAFIFTVLSAGGCVGALLAAPSTLGSIMFVAAALMALVQLGIISLFAWAMLQARTRDDAIEPVDVSA